MHTLSVVRSEVNAAWQSVGNTGIIYITYRALRIEMSRVSSFEQIIILLLVHFVTRHTDLC